MSELIPFLRIGAWANDAEVYIETGRKSGVTNVPLQALVWRKGKAGVYVAKNGRAHWKEITLGLRGSDKVETTSGLSKDEKMITGPDPSQLADGQRVSSQ